MITIGKKSKKKIPAANIPIRKISIVDIASDSPFDFKTVRGYIDPDAYAALYNHYVYDCNNGITAEFNCSTVSFDIHFPISPKDIFSDKLIDEILRTRPEGKTVSKEQFLKNDTLRIVVSQHNMSNLHELIAMTDARRNMKMFCSIAFTEGVCFATHHSEYDAHAVYCTEWLLCPKLMEILNSYFKMCSGKSTDFGRFDLDGTIAAWYKILMILKDYTDGTTNAWATHLQPPMPDFQERVKAGQYNDMPEKRFDIEIETYKILQALYDAAPDKTLRSMCIELLERARFSDDICDVLSNILGHITANAPYEPCTASNTNRGNMNGSKNKAGSMTPHQIYDYISTNVFKQTEAKKAAAMLIYNHERGSCRNIIMAGPTGCGKTEIWRTLARKFPYIKIINGPQLTGEGWKGDYKLADVFLDNPDIPNMILVIDEADKMLENNSSNVNYSSVMQNELLKLLDHDKGNTVTFRADRKSGLPQDEVIVDTSRVSVVLCGSFERMLQAKSNDSRSMGFLGQSSDTNCVVDECTEEDLVKYANMRVELAGRINEIIALDAIDVEDFVSILDHPTASPIRKIKAQLGVDIRIDNNAKRSLAEMAVKTKLGCRAITSRLYRAADSMMFTDPNKNNYDLSTEIMRHLE